jgi:hypothetical protein
MAFIEKHAKPGYTLFRGQPDRDCEGRKCKLWPGIAREKPAVSLDDEMALTGELERRGAYVEPLPRNEWEWMALAQQYGLPTRLLDWTRHALAALWFAVCEQRRGRWETRSTDAAVWLFRHTKDDIGKASKMPKKTLYEGIKTTQVLFPRTIDRRISIQASCFTVHARDGNGCFIALDDERQHRKKLARLRVDHRYFDILRRQLDLEGINEAVLFPDLDGLCSHILYSHRDKLRKP